MTCPYLVEPRLSHTTRRAVFARTLQRKAGALKQQSSGRFRNLLASARLALHLRPGTHVLRRTPMLHRSKTWDCSILHSIGKFMGSKEVAPRKSTHRQGTITTEPSAVSSFTAISALLASSRGKTATCGRIFSS